MWTWGFVAGLTGSLLMLLREDLFHHKLSNKLLVVSLLFCALWRAQQSDPAWFTSLATGSLLFTLSLPFWWFKKLGAGDVKLMFVIGLMLGWAHLPMMLTCLLILTFGLVICLKLQAWKQLFGQHSFGTWLNLVNRQGFLPYGSLLIPASLIPFWLQILFQS